MESERYVINYGKTQYEEYNSKDALKGQAVIAKYIMQDEPDYRDNLLIEALPPIRKMEDIYIDMYKTPIFSKEEKTKSDEYRLHAIYRLQDCVFPLAYNIIVDNQLGIVLRRGYVNKHIMTPEYIKKLKFISNYLINKDKIKELKETVCLNKNISSQSSGFLILGASGGGKSTAINHSLSYYPQVIRHVGYGDNKFLFTQITYLKIDCSYNGSIKGICQKFFAEIDSIAGTDYLKKYGNRSNGVEFMIVAMSHVACKHALGVLVIDEIQHLKNSIEGDGTLNFFVSMMNEINLPIIYIGTYKAMRTALMKDFRHGRRSLGIGNIEWKLMKNDIEWDTFINDLWKYQWVKNESPLTKEIKDMMFKKTMGITDRIIKLYMAVQFYAITSQTEVITPKIIEQIADEKFILTKGMIEALENGNNDILAKLEDMVTPSVDEMFQTSLSIATRKMVAEMAQSQMKENHLKKKELINDLIIFASGFGYDIKLTENIVTDIINKYGIKKEIEILKREIANRLITAEQNKDAEKENSPDKKRPKKDKAKMTNKELKDDILSSIKEVSDGITLKEDSCDRNIPENI